MIQSMDVQYYHLISTHHITLCFKDSDWAETLPQRFSSPLGETFSFAIRKSDPIVIAVARVLVRQ
jgi:hypothetical protein